MPTSQASVGTDKPARYGKQLAGHFGRKIDASWDGAKGTLPFGFGTCELVAEDDVLVLRGEAANAEDLERLENVVGSHLERFGQRDELAVSWQRDAD